MLRMKKTMDNTAIIAIIVLEWIKNKLKTKISNVAVIRVL